MGTETFFAFSNLYAMTIRLSFSPRVVFWPLILAVVFNFIFIGSSAQADPSRDFPPVPMRGYGTLSGSLTNSTINGEADSALSISCDDEDKAKLVLTKYLSDLQLLPGVEKVEIKSQQWGVGWVRFGGTPVSAYVVKDQGFVSALRLGAKVMILAAPSRGGLIALADQSLKGITGHVVSEPEAQVPMWLDRFDKYGFRFYYSTGMLPAKVKREDYDFRGDFTFAKNHGVGMVFWDELSTIMGADGQTSDSHWDWAEGLARLNNLSTAINLSASNFSIPTWVANRYREDGLMQPMPGYLGDSMSVANWRGNESRAGELAWGVTPARDAMLRALQTSVRHFNDHPNVTSWMEPLCELSQGGDDFMGYGPGADTTYREYLRGKYGSVDKVSQAWFGKPDALKSWDDVHAPELASFLGWGPDALDLGGSWRVANTDAAPPPEWTGAVFDDSTWLSVTAPGDDRNFFLPKKPAVYRRTFDLPADWPSKHAKTWIYLWDLNRTYNKEAPPVAIYLNGQKVAEERCQEPITHWMVAEATSFLKPGANQLSLILPSGYLGYRIYLSPTEPKQYPNLGEGANAQWVDLVGWRQKARVDSVGRGMQMIREVDPNRYITLASPNYALDGVKGLAQDYGGEFHNTGYMSGVWSDNLPSLMRGASLPFSLEPGNGAHDLTEFKTTLGLWSTEGVEQIDYFQHIGEIMWFPDLTKFFDDQQPLFHLFGKYHVPKADLGFLFCTETEALTGYPWLNDVNANLASGWVCEGVAKGMLDYCPRDYLTESDFDRGNAAGYKVIIDTNTSIMDEKLLGQIEKYVRDGGTFVTFVQTGRHTPTKPDSWPISKLTGYDVLTIENFDAEGHALRFNKDPHPTGSDQQPLMPAPGQQIYTEQAPWMNTPYVTGLRMKKAAADVQDLVLWKDGTVAIGMRKLGKGTIIEFGAKSNGSHWLGVDIHAFIPLLQWAGVKPNTVEAALDNPKAQNSPQYYFREFVSNNGLYNISTLWNPSRTDSIKATLTFKKNNPATARDVTTGQDIALQNGKLADLTLEPLQTRSFLTPRHQITDAPADWFDLQRHWWKASLPVTKPFPKPDERFVQDFAENWSWHPMGDKDDPQPWAIPGFDASAWIKLRLGAWNTVPEREAIKHGFLRRSFTVAKEWTNGRVELWIQTAGNSFFDKGRVWLDGKPLSSWFQESGISGLDLTSTLTPGTAHTLSAEVMSTGQLTGVGANIWIKYIPKPQATIDLAGPWTTCNADLFHDTGTVSLPGDYAANSIWRTINVPKEDEGKTVMLTTESGRPFHTFINGAMVRYSSANIPCTNAHTEINITPWIHFGQDNRIHLISTYPKGTMTHVALDLYDKGSYP
jgi:hypothetical protein